MIASGQQKQALQRERGQWEVLVCFARGRMLPVGEEEEEVVVERW